MKILWYRRRENLLKLLLISITAGFLPVCVGAQTSDPNHQFPSDSLKAQHLTEVLIKSRETALEIASPVPVQKLTGKELQMLNSLSVADAVRYFSGVQLKDYGGIGGLKTINVRSMGSNHTAVFYDGVQLGNAQNGQVDLGKFSLENIEEITLYNGQNPELLQAAKAYSSANSTYLKAKTPPFSKDKKYNAALALKTGSFGLLNGAGSLDYKLGKKLYATLSSELINSDGRYKFRYTNGVYDTTAIRNNGDIKAFRLEGAVYLKPDFVSSGSLRFYHYTSERGLPGAIVSNRFNYSQRLWDKNNFLQASFRRKINQDYTVLVNAKYANDYTRYLDPEFVSTDGFLDNKYTQEEAYISVANQYELFRFWKVNIAADYQYNTLSANLYRFAYPERNTLLAALSTALTFKRLNIQASLLSTHVNESVKEFQSAESKQEYTPTFMFNWQAFRYKNVRLRGFYKSIFRMPTFNDLYYTFVGNTYLKPEYTKQYDLGFAFLQLFKSGIVDYLDVQADVYYNTVTDKIIAVPSANLFRWTMLNMGEVSIKGFEVNTKIAKALNQDLSITGAINYTYQQALDITPDSYSYNNQIPYTPLHSGSVIASASRKQLAVNYSFIYTGERYSQKANIPVNYIQPWYTHDISGQYTLNLNNHQLKLRAEVNNLLNQYYDVILNFPMPGRSYRFTLNYSI